MYLLCGWRQCPADRQKLLDRILQAVKPHSAIHVALPVHVPAQPIKLLIPVCLSFADNSGRQSPEPVAVTVPARPSVNMERVVVTAQAVAGH